MFSITAHRAKHRFKRARSSLLALSAATVIAASSIQPAPVAAAGASTYTFRLESFNVIHKRSPGSDTDWVYFNLTVADKVYTTQIRKMGDVYNGSYQVGLEFKDIPIDSPSAPIRLSYEICNGGCGTSWLNGCDGLVAKDMVATTRSALEAQLGEIGYTAQTRSYPGSDSPAGCGSNSYYTVTYVMRRTLLVTPSTPIAATSRSMDLEDVFAVGPGGGIYANWFEKSAVGPFGGFNRVGGPGNGVASPMAPLTAISRSADHEDVFAVAPDGTVWTAWYDNNGGWGGWSRIGSGSNGIFPVGTRLAAVSLNAGHVRLFGVDGNGRALTTYYTTTANAWAPWYELNGSQPFPVGTPLTAIARQPGHIDVFGVEEHGMIMTTWEDTGRPWPSTWQRVGVGDNVLPLQTPIAAVSMNANHLELFGVARDWAIWHTVLTTTNGWLPWSPLPGMGRAPEGTPLTAIARDSNHLDLFAVADDGTIWTTRYATGASWLPGWIRIGAGGNGYLPQKTPLTAISRNPSHIDVFGSAIDGRIYIANYDSSTGWGLWNSIS